MQSNFATNPPSLFQFINAARLAAAIAPAQQPPARQRGGDEFEEFKALHN
jgi:hypothetical protein